MFYIYSIAYPQFRVRHCNNISSLTTC